MAAARDSAPVDVTRLIDDGPISGLQKRVIALCSLATFLDGYDVQALGLAVPGMAADFGVDPTAFAAALSGSLIGMALGAILLGPLADRLGRRRMLIAMLVLIGSSTIGVMFSRGPVELAAWRVLTGLGLGATVPIAITMTAEYAPARRCAALVTLMVACTGLGSFAAGLVAPFVEAYFGWRGIFGLGAMLPLAAAILLWFALPESLRFLLLRDPQDPAIQRQVLRIAPELVGRQLRVPPSVTVYKPRLSSLFAPALRARTALLSIIFWLNLFANYSLISWLPTLLAGTGWTRDAAQRATGILALGGIAGGLLLAWLADRGKAVPALACAYLFSAIALSLFALAPGAGVIWLIMLALIGASAIGAQVALGSLSASYYPAEVRSTGLGWAGGIGRIGSIFGPLALAGLMTLEFSANAILSFLMVPMLLCALAVTMLPRALRQPV